MENGRQLISSPEARLVWALNDRAYRSAFVEGHATDTVAFQLRAMRKAEGWDQADVAERLGNRKLQPMISRYENPDYGKYSIATLLELAEVFDVALAVRFVPFSELVEWDLSSDPAKDLPIPFEKDTRLKGIANRKAEPNQRLSQLSGTPRLDELNSDISAQDALGGTKEGLSENGLEAIA